MDMCVPDSLSKSFGKEVETVIFVSFRILREQAKVGVVKFLLGQAASPSSRSPCGVHAPKFSQSSPDRRTEFSPCPTFLITRRGKTAIFLVEFP